MYYANNNTNSSKFFFFLWNKYPINIKKYKKKWVSFKLALLTIAGPDHNMNRQIKDQNFHYYEFQVIIDYSIYCPNVDYSFAKKRYITKDELFEYWG